MLGVWLFGYGGSGFSVAVALGAEADVQPSSAMAMA